MKRSILATFALLLSLVAFAAPLPQEQLERINNFIAASMGALNEQLVVTVSEAEIEESNGLLKRVKAQADFLGLIQASIGLGLEGDIINLSGGLAANAAEFELSSDDVLGLLAEVRNFADAINAKGDYLATITENESATQTQIIATVVPARQDPSLSVASFEILVNVPKDSHAGLVEATFTGSFNSVSATVSMAQTALSNIVKALANEQAPAQSDLDTLFEIVAEILGSIDF